MTQTLVTCVTVPEAHADRRDDMTDEELTSVYEANVCDVALTGWDGLCGYPLDDDGRCEVHQ